MRIYKVRKRSGKFRTIYAPDKNEMITLRALVAPLRSLAESSNIGVQHGFQPRRSSVTNAMQHRGHRYTVSFDLQDFFDSVTRDKFRVFGVSITSSLYDICFPFGAARQGLPTSPMLANIAAAPMDKEIMALLGDNIRQPNRRLAIGEGVKRECVYTRYADDLTFSFDSVLWFDLLKTKVPEIVERHGFKINPNKTHTQNAAGGRRIITGVAVDSDIHIPRAVKRRLRAAKHQRKTAQVRGLSEWCKLRMPKGYDASNPQKANAKTNTVTNRPETKKPTTINKALGAIVPMLRRIIRLED